MRVREAMEQHDRRACAFIGDLEAEPIGLDPRHQRVVLMTRRC
jgi:hypothetical protein